MWGLIQWDGEHRNADKWKVNTESQNALVLKLTVVMFDSWMNHYFKQVILRRLIHRTELKQTLILISTSRWVIKPKNRFEMKETILQAGVIFGKLQQLRLIYTSASDLYRRLRVFFHSYFCVVFCVDVQLHMQTTSRQCPLVMLMVAKAEEAAACCVHCWRRSSSDGGK